MRHAPLALIAAGALVGSTALAQAADSWDMPTPYPDGNFHTQNVRAFAEDVKSMTGGELDIQVHSGASLFKMPEIKRAVRSGQAPIGEILLSAYGNESPIFEVDGIPFLAAGYDNAWKLYQAQKPILEGLLAEEGLMLLFSVPWPGQALYTQEAISSVDDMKGVKFRAYNAATSRLAELMGALPTTVQYAEVPQAFATGLVSSMLTSGTTGVDTQSWDFVKYFYDTNAMHPKNATFVNKKSFDKLDPAVQEAVRKAAAAAEERGWQMSRQAGSAAVQELRDNNMEVVTPDDKLMGQLETIGGTMTDEWLAKAGAQGKTLIDNYNAQ
ncbi:MAG: TRAP transporter substrate-binding protein [Pseudomonadota bacterium]